MKHNPAMAYRPLSTTLFRTVMGFSLITTLVFSFSTMVFRYADFFNEITGEMDEIYESQKSQLAVSLWNIDKPMVAVQLDGILRSPRIHHVAISTQDSQHYGRGQENILRPWSKEYPLYFTNQEGKAWEIGRIVLTSDLDKAMALMISELWGPVVWQTLVQLLITLFLLALVRTIFIQRLKKLSDYFGQLDEKTLHTPLDITYPGMDHLNELDVVAERVNQMREGLLEAFQARKSAEARLHENAQVIQQQLAQLEAQNSELERFTYTVSHDLRSPLITIHGFSQYFFEDMKKGNLERAQQDMQKILGAVDKMSHLLNDLLEMSRVGRVISDPTSFTMSQALEEALELLEGSLKQTGASFRTVCLDVIVSADHLRIREVWQNLVENALKYQISQGIPNLEAGSLEVEGERRFYLKDNGKGIPSHYLEKIFGLFEKIDAHSQGTGIGLALVKRIITLHGGRIWAESEGEGKGTTFWFTLGTQ